MAIGIIHLLEIVDVNEKNRETFMVSFCVSQYMIQFFFELLSIRKIR